MHKIQYCRCKVNLSGQNCHTVIYDEFTPVTWPEVQVLMQLHGEENVMEVAPVGIGETYPSAEKNRLIAIYGKSVVETCFPGRAFRMEYVMTADEDLPRYEDGKLVPKETDPTVKVDIETLASEPSAPIFKPGRNRPPTPTAA